MGIKLIKKTNKKGEDLRNLKTFKSMHVRLVKKRNEEATADEFGKNAAVTIQRLVDGDPGRYNKTDDSLAAIIRTYAIRNRTRIPADIDSFREYQKAVVDNLHGISPEARRYAKELLGRWQ